jgi:hypothetical protein
MQSHATENLAFHRNLLVGGSVSAAKLDPPERADIGYYLSKWLFVDSSGRFRSVRAAGALVNIEFLGCPSG